MAALAAAALLSIGAGSPAAAQSCDEFGSAKEAQRALEQVGDASGLLDPDGNGLACDGAAAAAQEAAPAVDGAAGGEAAAEPVAEPAAEPEPIERTGPDRVLSTGTAINQDGPVTSNNAAGASGETTEIVTTEVSTDDGNAAEIGAEPVAEAEEPVANDRGRRRDAAAGEAVAVDEPNGRRAQAGEALAIDDGAAAAPQAEAEQPLVAPVPQASAPAAAPAPALPIRLPSTGVGGAADSGAATALGLLAASLALGAAVVGRRTRRA